ncbi:sigma-70 family RNA polymerase sigma factor [Cytobacillus sp. Hz8]|uniref:sigma-70 family RNA polymerase sigma factor n=1 Tax=Cytobacillus sp. Hz8 TaxID=3347168 RepID=UPI0035DC3159
MDEIAIEVIGIEDKEKWIDELMTQFGQEILQLVFSYVKNREIAEDLTQDIFVKCYKSLDTYKGQSKIRTWLWRIAINHCKDYLKSWYNRKVMITDTEPNQSTSSNDIVEQSVIQKDEDRMLVSAVMDLPIKYREIIYLYYFEERSIKEIASMIGENENTIKTRHRRAKELLRKGMGNHHGRTIKRTAKINGKDSL